MIAIPAFILKKFYVPESLQQTPEGVEFALQNPICPGSFTSIAGIGLSAKAKESPKDLKATPAILWCPPERLVFLFENGTQLQGHEVSPESPVPIPLHSKATCLLKEFTLHQVSQLAEASPDEDAQATSDTFSYTLHIDASLHGLGRLTVHIPV